MTNWQTAFCSTKFRSSVSRPLVTILSSCITASQTLLHTTGFGSSTNTRPSIARFVRFPASWRGPAAKTSPSIPSSRTPSLILFVHDGHHSAGVHPGLHDTRVLAQLQEGQGKLLAEFRWPSHLPLQPARRLQRGVRAHGLHWGGIQTAGEIKWMNDARGASERRRAQRRSSRTEWDGDKTSARIKKSKSESSV